MGWLGSKISMESESVYHQDNLTSELRPWICERQSEMKTAWDESKSNISFHHLTLLCRAYRAAIYMTLDNLKVLLHRSFFIIYTGPTCGIIPILKIKNILA